MISNKVNKFLLRHISEKNSPVFYLIQSQKNDFVLQMQLLV